VVEVKAGDDAVESSHWPIFGMKFYESAYVRVTTLLNFAIRWLDTRVRVLNPLYTYDMGWR
jgi:hypothetical protein